MSYQYGQQPNPYANAPASNNPYDQYEMSNLNASGRNANASGPTGGAAGGAAGSGRGDNDMVVFFAEIDEVKKYLVQYDDNVERVESLHKRSLAETDVSAQAMIQKQIDGLAAETREIADTLKHRIKSLEAKSQRDPTKKTQADNLKRYFMQLIQKYQATEATFRQRYRDVAERQFRIVQPDASESEVQQAIDDSEGQQIFSQALMQSNRRGQARAALSEVQERHQEIQKIERTMTELAELFHDMEILVAEQEEQVQQIDNQAASAQHDIEAGVGYQQKAIISARKWRKKKVWCFAIVVFIVVVLAVVLGAYFGTR